MLQSCHQQRPFLRDACSTEKEGLLHKETLRCTGARPTGEAVALSPASPEGTVEQAEDSRGLLCQLLPAPLLETCFSFCSFLSGRRVGGEGSAGDSVATPGSGALSEPELLAAEQLLHTLSSAGLRAPQGARSLPLSVPSRGPSPLLRECL